MAIVTIHSLTEFESFIGKEIGVTGWLPVTQEMINQFALATLDDQWIHTDPERAAIESPFKSTIAHGYLTVSLLAYFWYQLVEFKNVKMMVNYGIEKLRFQQPVLVNTDLRVRVFLQSLNNLRGVIKAQMKVIMEIRDSKKPAFEGEVIFLYHFN